VMIAQCSMGCLIIVLFLLVDPWVGGYRFILTPIAEEKKRALRG